MYLFNPLSLITPDIGFSFWTLVAFVIFWFIAGKFAIKPIVNSIQARNMKIENELLEAKKARQEFEELQSKNDAMQKAAHEERQQMLMNAKKEAEAFRATEMQKAKEDAAKMLEMAKVEIDNQKRSAINEIKKEVSGLSISIAEKLVKEKLSDSSAQQTLVDKLLNESLSSN